MPDVVVVAAEELIAAFSRQRNLDVLAGELGDQIGGDRGRVGERLVEDIRHRGQKRGAVGAHDDLVVIGRVAIGDEPSSLALVEVAFLEADGERLHGPGAHLRGERDDQRRIDPAREEDTDGNVGHQMGADRIAEAVSQLLGQRFLVLGADLIGRDWTRPGVAFDAQRSGSCRPAR